MNGTRHHDDMGSLIRESTFGIVLSMYDNKPLMLCLCACMGETTSISTYTHSARPTETHTHRPKIYKHVMGFSVETTKKRNALLLKK